MTNNSQQSQKPAIGIMHNLARSGGTLVGRCLGSMSGVRLLSEIHPQGIRYFNPVEQAANWFGLVDLKEMQAFASKQENFSFSDAIEIIHSKCINEGSHLVLRDWAYLDFIGIPFNPSPSCEHVLSKTLETAFQLHEVSLVRHPVDQWLSLTRDPNIAQRLTLKQYIKGCLRYARRCQDHTFIHYEDFTREPETNMQQICKNLGIEYNADFMHKWSSYQHITGDPETYNRNTITEVRRYPVPKKLRKQLSKNREYDETIHLLGYEDPTRQR